MQSSGKCPKSGIAKQMYAKQVATKITDLDTVNLLERWQHAGKVGVCYKS